MAAMAQDAAEETAAEEAPAADEAESNFSWNLSFTSDYVFRGVSQTEEEAAIQAGADLTNGTVYAGAWASNVDFGDDTDAEIDLYAGVKPTYAGFTFDVGVIGYFYPGAPDFADWDYVEGKIAVSHPINDTASWGVAAFYSDDFTGGTGPAWYYELNASTKLAEKWSLSGGLGRQEIDLAGDYTTWNLGVGYAFTDHVAVDLRYWDTDEHSYGDIFGSRAVISLKGTF